MHGAAWKVRCLIELDGVTSVPETPVVKINQPQEEGTTRLSRIGLHPLMRSIAFCIIVSELRMDSFSVGS